MEKARETTANEKNKLLQQRPDLQSRVIWDCGSTLYDSFELKSLKRQLDSAISARSLSMPHLADRCAFPPQPQPQPLAKKHSKLSRSILKLLQSVFKSKPNGSSPAFSVNKGHKCSRSHGDQSNDRFYVLYDTAGSLLTIPEAPELDCFSTALPETSRHVRKTESERFTAGRSVTVSCG